MHTNSSIIIMASAIALILTGPIFAFTLTNQAFAMLPYTGGPHQIYHVLLHLVSTPYRDALVPQIPGLSAGNGIASIHEMFVNILGSQQSGGNGGFGCWHCPECGPCPVGSGPQIVVPLLPLSPFDQIISKSHNPN